MANEMNRETDTKKKKKDRKNEPQPERQDKTQRIISPISWIVLLLLTAVVVGVVIWAFTGTIPTTVSGKGIIAAPSGTNADYIDEAGTIVSVTAKVGMTVERGTVILTYETADEKVKELTSTQAGTVSEVLVKAGDTAKQGTEVVRVSPPAISDQVAVFYVALSKFNKVELGDTVQVSLDSAETQTYGHMWGRVIAIDSHAATTTGMNAVLGSDNYLTSTIQNSGSVVAVTCELYPDDTMNGYRWTKAAGESVTVTNGSPVTCKIEVEQKRPIDKMFSNLADR